MDRYVDFLLSLPTAIGFTVFLASVFLAAFSVLVSVGLLFFAGAGWVVGLMVAGWLVYCVVYAIQASLSRRK